MSAIDWEKLELEMRCAATVVFNQERAWGSSEAEAFAQASAYVLRTFCKLQGIEPKEIAAEDLRRLNTILTTTIK